MKGIKLLAFLAISVMLLSICGCGQRNGNKEQTTFSQINTEPLQQQPQVSLPTDKELETMLYIFDSIVLSYEDEEGEYSIKNENYADILLMYVINNYNTEINGVEVKQDSSGITTGFEISVSNMNALASACFGDASAFLETPHSTEHFQFESNSNMYVLTDLSDRGAPPYPKIKGAEKMSDGRFKVVVDFLNEEDNFFASTYYFYLVPNTRDLSGTYPWSVASFEQAMSAVSLYNMLPLEQMSHNIKIPSGNTPLYQPVVLSWEGDSSGTGVVVARMYRYNKSKKFEIKDNYIINEYYKNDENDGDYKFTLALSDNKYIIRNMQKQ